MSHDLGQFRPPPEPLDRRVRVHLDKLYGPPPPDTTPAEETSGSLRTRMRHNLRLTGWVPGTLRWWVRSADGRWLGLCDYTIPDAGGALVIRQEQVAVPADALEPLDDQPRH